MVTEQKSQNMDTSQGTGTFPKGPPNNHQTLTPSQLPVPSSWWKARGGHAHACTGHTPEAGI